MGNIRTLEEATAYLEQLIDVERRPDLPYARLDVGPIRRLLARLEDPHQGLRVIHIAGSKGKGSTALFAEAICRAAGLRVGTFTSPHLERWTERFRIDGREVDDERLVGAVAKIRPHVDALRTEDPAVAPTFFDATTAAALLLFAEAPVDCVMLEVGLGGRLDSTNVVVPDVTCVTSVELEHTDKLGDSLAEIAAEKAGILEPGVPAVAGDLPPAAREVVAARAAAIGTEVAWLGRDFDAKVRSRGPEGLALRLSDGPVCVDASVPVLGAHQAANAALALACVRRTGWVSEAKLAVAAAEGLSAAALPGRVEVLGRQPWLLVDGAHTAVSARALAEALAELPRRRTHLVLSISSGKDAPAILDALLSQADSVTVTRAEPIRSLAPETLAAAVRAAKPELPLRVVPEPFEAIRAARAEISAGDLLCATGSVYLAGIARQVLRDPQPSVETARSGADSWMPRGGA